MTKLQSAERVSATELSDNFVFRRSELAYSRAAELVSGAVLEIGTGSGYGIEMISPRAETFTTIDKNQPPIEFDQYSNVNFIKLKVPPLDEIETAAYDCVLMFQVLEHISNDHLVMAEIYRVLKPGGILLITTPNRLMSLTRNPWHVREYSPSELERLLTMYFDRVEQYGVFGNDNVTEYYQKNRESVRKIARFDLFRFHKWLPSGLLRIPYDILNRINRRKLLRDNNDLTAGLVMEDYSIEPVSESAYDLFYIAHKSSPDC